MAFMAKVSVFFCLAFFGSAMLKNTGAVPGKLTNVDSVFHDLCPSYVYTVVDPAIECSEEVIETLAETSEVAKEYLDLAEQEMLCRDSADLEVESACEILDRICSPVVQCHSEVRFRRSSSNSTESTSVESSEESLSVETD